MGLLGNSTPTGGEEPSVKESLSNGLNRTSIKNAKTVLENTWKNNRKLIYIAEVFLIWLAAFLAAKLQFGLHSDVTVFNCLIYACKGPGVWLVFILAVNSLAYYIVAMFHRDGQIQDGENYQTASGNNDIKGSGNSMQKDELEKTFYATDYAGVKSDILGADPNDRSKKLTLKYDYKINGGHNFNSHKLAVGSSGAGKTRSQVMPSLLVNIMLGNSIICMDPKLETYGKTAAMARARGYTVKTINLNRDFLLHSNSCNFLQQLGDSPLAAKALADVIIYNLGDNKSIPFWDDMMSAKLTFDILYVKDGCPGNDDLAGMYPKTLGGVYRYLSERSKEQIMLDGQMLPEGHPAKQYFQVFAGSSDAIKESTLGSLRSKLSPLGIAEIEHIASDDDIDLSLPGKEKCIYYIGIGSDKSVQFLSALFWSLEMSILESQAKRAKGEDKRLKQDVIFILDEFVNCGMLGDRYLQFLTVCRSYGISLHMYVQDLAQLERAYPDGGVDTIIGNCSALVLLKTASNKDAEYFSVRSGVKTVVDESRRYERKAGALFDLHGSYQITTQNGERAVYTLDEILRLNPKHNIVFIAGHNPVEVARIDYSEMPYCKEIRKLDANTVMPPWLKKLLEENPSEVERLSLSADECFEEEIPWGTEGYEIERCTKEDLKEDWNSKKERILRRKVNKQIADAYGIKAPERLSKKECDEVKEMFADSVSDWTDFIDTSDYSDIDVLDSLGHSA